MKRLSMSKKKINVLLPENIHHNEPGVLQQINEIVARQGVNIAAQFLQTQGRIGYLLVDLELEDAEPILQDRRAVSTTIRSRVLY